MSDFLGYLRDISNGDPQIRLAQVSGASQTTVSRWATVRPNAEAIVALARHYQRPIAEVMVAAGYPEAAHSPSGRARTPLSEYTHSALLRELERRLDARSSDPSGTISSPDQYGEEPTPDDYDLAAGEHRALVYVLAYGGLRWGEAVALRGRDVDGARVRVDRAVVPTKSGWQVGTPKTHERRTLYLPSFVAQLLPTPERDDLIFPAQRGDFLRTPGKVQRGRRQWWQASLEAVGVEYLRIHDLRHTAASLAVQAGAHVKAVQRMLGHRSAAMTLDVYSDLWDSDLDAVAGALDAARAAAVGHDLGTDQRDMAGTGGHLRVVAGTA